MDRCEHGYLRLTCGVCQRGKGRSLRDQSQPVVQNGMTINLGDVIMRATERIDRTAMMTKRMEGAAVRSTFPIQEGE